MQNLAFETRPTPGQSWREARSLADLALIFEPGVNMVFLRRRMSPCVERYAGALAHSAPFATQLATSARAPQLKDLLPAATDFRRELLLRDIARLAELYCDLTEARELGLRFRNLQSAMCPRFHTDRVGIRLICTYAGAGTEWLANEDADRSNLGSRAVPDGKPDPVPRSGSIVQRVPTLAIALLKGDSWPGEESRGVVHRSPATNTGTPRTLLTIDAVMT